MPREYVTEAESLKSSLVISIYVMETADIKAAGNAVISEASLFLLVFNKYAVATQRVIIASVWLLRENIFTVR